VAITVLVGVTISCFPVMGVAVYLYNYMLEHNSFQPLPRETRTHFKQQWCRRVVRKVVRKVVRSNLTNLTGGTSPDRGKRVGREVRMEGMEGGLGRNRKMEGGEGGREQGREQGKKR